MNKLLILILIFLPTFSYANASIEEKLFVEVNDAIFILGQRVKVCKEIESQNKPNNKTIEFVKNRLEKLAPILAYLNYLAIERCSFSEKTNLAYSLLIAKNNTQRLTTLELIKATEKLNFVLDKASQSRFDALNPELKEYLLKSAFFSKPFNVLELYELASTM
ncbi:hypothetical protein [Rheinheimera sp. MMS21-TC3]|uniref:hypothetical protein n=1 Tax=Rheinheimera sp. MMS21-TC3 TaxID=3072790 RepID=UPI0028C386C4|nr:hypothetical protein [Rheinheimera sp. MMS21-TC3]WNO60238.1 hypothetical protein RDV63_04550 [Rheinheimera sp. MMS21-TC3]